MRNWTTQHALNNVPSDKYNLALRNCVVFADTIARTIGSKAYTPMNSIRNTKDAIAQAFISQADNRLLNPQSQAARSYDLPLEIPQRSIRKLPYDYMKELRNKNISRHTSIGQLYPTNLSR